MIEDIRGIGTLDMMTKEQIRQNLREQMQKMGNSVESMVLTWRKIRTEYVLEIVVPGKATDVCECSDAGETAAYRLIIGKAKASISNPLGRLLAEGQRLYFCLRKEFPALHRRLSTYK